MSPRVPPGWLLAAAAAALTLSTAAAPAQAQPGTTPPGPPQPGTTPPGPPQPTPPPPPTPPPAEPAPAVPPPPTGATVVSVQRPEPLAQPQKPPSGPEDSKPAATVFFHGLCPAAARNPHCSYGLWMGFRGILFRRLQPDVPIGLVGDVKAGFGFGAGWEVNADPGAHDSMGHVMADAEAGVGPGLALGLVDFFPALGVGMEGIAWGSTATEDDAFGELYWYAGATVQAHLTDDFGVLAGGARRFRHEGIEDVYADRVELGAFWTTDKAPLVLTVWYYEYDEEALKVGGLAFGFRGGDSSRR